MKIIITGNSFEQLHEPTEQVFQNLLKRLTLDVEIWNRDHISDQRQLIQAEVWPIPEPEPPEE